MMQLLTTSSVLLTCLQFAVAIVRGRKANIYMLTIFATVRLAWC
jgi:hypothetical protein